MTALTTQALNHSITMDQKLRAKDTQIKELTERLEQFKYCLDTRVATMEVQIQEGRGDYSPADLEDFILSAKLLNQYYGRKYSVSGVEELMNKI